MHDGCAHVCTSSRLQAPDGFRYVRSSTLLFEAQGEFWMNLIWDEPGP